MPFRHASTLRAKNKDERQPSQKEDGNESACAGNR
jgi:hypothetical protein